MERRVHIVKEVPHMPNNNPHQLVLGHRPVYNKADAHKHPRQVWRTEDEQPEEAHKRIRVAARPDVDERRRQRVAEEGHRDEGGEEEQAGHGVDEEPREVGGGPAGGFLEQAGVALEEVDVEQEVDRDGAEVEEGG